MNFIKATISGHERALFRAKYHDPKLPNADAIELQKLSQATELFIRSGTANYFNIVYEALVNKNDPYINGTFDMCCKMLNHSPVCLTILAFQSCTDIHLNMNRSLFLDRGKLEYLEDYSASVKIQLDLILGDSFEASLRECLNHRCEGAKEAKPLPNGEKFFKVVTEEPIDETKPSPSTATLPDKKCGVCGKASETKCGQCKAKYYCSLDCQKKDWSTHKRICQAIPK